jgi:hypothetical protein
MLGYTCCEKKLTDERKSLELAPAINIAQSVTGWAMRSKKLFP